MYIQLAVGKSFRIRDNMRRSRLTCHLSDAAFRAMMVVCQLLALHHDSCIMLDDIAMHAYVQVLLMAMNIIHACLHWCIIVESVYILYLY